MKKTLFALVALIALLITSCTTGLDKEAGLKIEFEKYQLENGLDVVLSQDFSDPVVAVAIYYHVGSSREEPGKTGFAHLFEHMMFQESENVGQDEFFKNITESGGSLNGSTSNDRTNYYEVVPKNAAEVVLWMESDRMGFLRNTVTQSAFVNQQNIVQNEKRQSVDNAPYGHNSALIAKTLYPEGHPYSWTVIGKMEDLTGATVDDVKAFHEKFYSPNNATLVIAGDFEKDEMKALIEKYFGSLPGGEEIEDPKPMPVELAETIKLFHEDNFARSPQLTMVFPTAEKYSKDSYALNFLGQLLSSGKKAPLYNVLVKEKKLTSNVSARNRSLERAGTFTFSSSANPQIGLSEIENAIFEGLERFEKEGFTEEDLQRIKAGYETRYYNSFSSVQGKAFTFAEYNMYTGDPGFYKKDLENALAVTAEDINAVYNKYIKGRNYVATSFVPKGKLELVAESSVSAGIVEEDLASAAEVVALDIEEEPIVKSATTFDRTVKPEYGPDPEVKLPEIWTGSLGNGVKIWGIEKSDLPMVDYGIVIDGGHMLDKLDKAGTANLMATMLSAGTANKTPEELEDAIKTLGASIRISAGNESINISVSCLAKYFEQTFELVEEMLLEPRWDEVEFDIAKSRVINSFRRLKSNPNSLARQTMNELIFGDNILGISTSGNETTVPQITIDDLKDFYNTNLSPSYARFTIVGDVEEDRVMATLSGLSDKWLAKEVMFPEFTQPGAPEKSAIYFVDVPGAKQSVINIGAPALPRGDKDYYPATIINHKLGGASLSGIFNQILREEKGFTYGAGSRFSGQKNYGTFSASSMVRTNATFESVYIFKTEMEKYIEGVPQDYIDFTKSATLKGNARRFETSRSLMGMLSIISTYDMPADYIKSEEAFVRALTIDNHREIAQKYINPGAMYYVVAGDAATQIKGLKDIGFGDPILVK